MFFRTIERRFPSFQGFTLDYFKISVSPFGLNRRGAAVTYFDIVSNGVPDV